MPPMPTSAGGGGTGTDPLSDPLGIQADGGDGGPPKLHVNVPPPTAQVGEKRRASQDLMLSPTKRLAFTYK